MYKIKIKIAWCLVWALDKMSISVILNVVLFNDYCIPREGNIGVGGGCVSFLQEFKNWDKLRRIRIDRSEMVNYGNKIL